MNDLIYLSSREEYNKLARQITAWREDVVIEDASDCIHLHRFSVDLDIPVDEWLMASLINGFFDCSLSWNLLTMENPQKANVMMRTATNYLRNRRLNHA